MTRYTESPLWDQMRELGYETDYVSIDRECVIAPMFLPDDLKAKGFFVRGTKAAFINRNGYEGERVLAATAFAEHPAVTVKSCRIGSSSSDYEFEEVPGRWNTVMFAKATPSTAPTIPVVASHTAMNKEGVGHPPEDSGVPSGTGSREPNPAVSALTGFDPLTQEDQS